jgi:hypothetical protein
VSRVNEARKELDAEIRRVCGKNSHQLVERLIDLIREVRDELRRIDTNVRK